MKEEPEKRDLSEDDLVKILKAEAVPGKRMQLARDVLALSFYLLAMNTADLFGDDAELGAFCCDQAYLLIPDLLIELMI